MSKSKIRATIAKRMPWEKDDKQSKGYTKVSRDGFYNSSDWKKVRRYILDNEPLCRECLREGKTRPAVIVDHIVPLTPDSTMDDKLNMEGLRPVCEHHHRLITRLDNSKKSPQNLRKGRELMDFLESD